MALFLYLGLYSWNLRTGFLDSIASNTGLEFIGWVLAPGKWVKTKVGDFLDHYIYLVDVQKENDELRSRLNELNLDLAGYMERAREVGRLRALLSFSPPVDWETVGARVAAHRLGPYSALQTCILDKGHLTGAQENTPVATHQGVVGRILRASAHTSTMLLLTDARSRIAVMGQIHRTPGILSGNGPNAKLDVLYVPLNSVLEPGETLITSGLDGVFPKGLPAAVVTSIERSDISLFQKVQARVKVDLKSLEEVLLLKRKKGAAGEAPIKGDQASEPRAGP